MGVIAPGTRLTSRPPEIPAWDSFSSEERRVFLRQMENYADFLEHTDYEVGRLVQSLEEMEELENTLFIYILGDNGSSAEGSIRGTISELAAMQGIEPPIEASIERIDEIGFLLSRRERSVVLGLGTAQRNIAGAMVIASRDFSDPPLRRIRCR
jgi:arylsulfatase